MITGPPGTGKSQAVANILAVCALNKKSVLFASKNNQAVDVVYEKLRLMLDQDNWLLRLGNREKIQDAGNGSWLSSLLPESPRLFPSG